MASIPGNVATSIFDIIRRLEDRVVPFIKDVVDKSVSESVDIAHDTAQDALNVITEDLNKLKTTVEQHAPSSSPSR